MKREKKIKVEKWNKLSCEYLLRCKWLNIRKDFVQLPNGVKLDDFYILEYPNWVNVIAITDKGLFVMERQYRHGLEQVNYEICAGTCEDKETPLTAAKRELLEETGYAGGEWTLFGISAPNPAAMTNLNYTFLAKGVKKISEPHQESTEEIEILLMSPKQVRHLLENEEIKQGCMLAMLWKYFAIYL